MTTPVQLPPFFRGATVDKRASSLPYHLADIRMPKHWEHTGAGEGVVVGVADTGIDQDHPEIAGRIIDAQSFIPGEGHQDGNDHGTHVATTIAGENVGVAPKSRLLIAKVLGNNGSGSNRGVAEGIRWLANAGANIINLSLGGPYDDPETRVAILEAIHMGVLCVAATGNERASHVGYPAVHCIGVGAVDRGLKLAYFSNRGKNVDIVGYGVDVYAGIPGGRYAEFSGTSMATPFFAGVVANRLSAEIKHQGEITTKNTDDLLKLETFVTDLGPGGRDTSFGRGFPDLDRALYKNLQPLVDPDQPDPSEPSDPVAGNGEPIEIRLRGMESGKAYTTVAAFPVQ